MKIAVLVLDHLDNAVNRKPIGVDVPQRHKDGDHDAFVMKIFILHCLFKYDYCSVGGCDNQSFRVTVEETDGAAEEVKEDDVNGRCNG